MSWNVPSQPNLYSLESTTCPSLRVPARSPKYKLPFTSNTPPCGLLIGLKKSSVALLLGLDGVVLNSPVFGLISNLRILSRSTSLTYR